MGRGGDVIHSSQFTVHSSPSILHVLISKLSASFASALRFPFSVSFFTSTLRLKYAHYAECRESLPALVLNFEF